jgi:hypothetical protein
VSIFDMILRDLADGSIEVGPAAMPGQMPEPIHHGAQAVGWTDATGDHYYPGYGPSPEDEGES